MNGFALLPLDTSHSLPGWPVPPPVPGLDFFIVLVFIPAAITLIIVLGVTASNMRKNNRITAEGVTDEPQTPQVGPGGEAAAVEGSDTRELAAQPSGAAMTDPAAAGEAEPAAARRADQPPR